MEKQEKTKENTEERKAEQKKTCPDCGSNELIVAGRCATCGSCGWSLCSM